ncbi:MAG: hypothetical protein GY793_08620 [Proteobacteria bacterium]|nr:hypothetical protein [Pseudomonadota bacterium]
MLKNIILIIFCVIFILFALDNFKLTPSDRVLSLNKITYIQKAQINSFDEEPQNKSKSVDKKHPFTSRVSKQSPQN